MEFEINLANVQKSIYLAKRQGARLRSGPELELTGCAFFTSASCQQHHSDLPRQYGVLFCTSPAVHYV